MHRRTYTIGRHGEAHKYAADGKCLMTDKDRKIHPHIYGQKLGARVKAENPRKNKGKGGKKRA